MLTDRRSRAIRTLAGAAMVAAFVVLPDPAGAHGIGESAAGRTIPEFIPLGMEHMLLGWDHLVFIAGVLLLASGIREAAKLISLFVLGHSLTLIVATLAGWQPSSASYRPATANVSFRPASRLSWPRG